MCTLRNLLGGRTKRILLLRHHDIIFIRLTLSVRPNSVKLGRLTTNLFVSSDYLSRHQRHLIGVLSGLKIRNSITAFSQQHRRIAITIMSNTAFNVRNLHGRTTHVNALTRFVNFSGLVINGTGSTRTRTGPGRTRSNFTTEREHTYRPFNQQALTQPSIVRLETTQTTGSQHQIITAKLPNIMELPAHSLVAEASPQQKASEATTPVKATTVIVYRARLPSYC